MSKKKQTLEKIDDEFYYSEDWPYADVYFNPLEESHLPLADDAQLELPKIKTEDLFSGLNPQKEIVVVQSRIPRRSTKGNLISFIGGAITSSLVLFLLLYSPKQPEVPQDALVLLRELSQQFEIQSAVTELHSNAVSPYKQLDGPNFIERLRIKDSHVDKQIWIEASQRRDERVTIALLDLLDGAPERTQIRALLSLSAQFHAEQSSVFRRVVSGIQNDFSPFVRAYATKMIIHTYGPRAKKFLQSRMLVEKDSFVLAITTRMLQTLPELATASIHTEEQS